MQHRIQIQKMEYSPLIYNAPVNMLNYQFFLSFKKIDNLVLIYEILVNILKKIDSFVLVYEVFVNILKKIDSFILVYDVFIKKSVY